VRDVPLMLLAMVPAVWVLASTRSGPGISPDSVGYLSAARSFSELGTLKTYAGVPISTWPPGLPLLLGLFEKLGVGGESAAVGLNVVCAFVTVVLTYVLTAEACRSRTLGLVAAGIVGCSASTVAVYSMLWSEPPFVTLVLVALVGLSRGIRQRGTSMPQLVTVGAAVSLATSMRYVGVGLIPLVGLGVLLAERDRGPVARCVRAVSATALSAVGLVLVAMRNLMLGYGALGDRTGLTSVEKPGSVLADTIRTLGHYVIPDYRFALAPGVLVALLVVFGAVRAVWMRQYEVLLLISYTCLYWAFVVVSSLTTMVDPVNERLAAPAFVPMVAIAIYGVSGVQRGAESLSPHWHRRVTSGLAAILVLLLAVSSLKSVDYVWHSARDGVGINSSAVPDSPLSRTVAALPSTVGVASDDPYLLYWQSQHVPVVPIPEPVVGHYGDYRTPAALNRERAAQLVSSVASGRVTYLALFKDDESAARSVREAGLGLRLVGRFRDGELYSLTSDRH
jgi:4-amino-4-deoxy-L-arabinose transferase-like glycosyltransferase